MRFSVIHEKVSALLLLALALTFVSCLADASGETKTQRLRKKRVPNVRPAPKTDVRIQRRAEAQRLRGKRVPNVQPAPKTDVRIQRRVETKTQRLRKKRVPIVRPAPETDVIKQRRVVREVVSSERSLESNHHSNSGMGVMPNGLRHGIVDEDEKEHANNMGDGQEEVQNNEEYENIRIAELPNEIPEHKDVENAEKSDADSLDENTSDARRRHHDPPEERDVLGDSIYPPYGSNNVFGNRAPDP